MQRESIPERAIHRHSFVGDLPWDLYRAHDTAIVNAYRAHDCLSYVNRGRPERICGPYPDEDWEAFLENYVDISSELRLLLQLKPELDAVSGGVVHIGSVYAASAHEAAMMLAYKILRTLLDEVWPEVMKWHDIFFQSLFQCDWMHMCDSVTTDFFDEYVEIDFDTEDQMYYGFLEFFKKNARDLEERHAPDVLVRDEAFRAVAALPTFEVSELVAMICRETVLAQRWRIENNVPARGEAPPRHGKWLGSPPPEPSKFKWGPITGQIKNIAKWLVVRQCRVY